MANYEWFMKAHRFVYHYTDGWVGGKLGCAPMALLYTIGAKTGRSRLAPLQYYPDPDGVLVLASNNGQAKAPAWYHNLKAHPDIDIRVGRRTRRVRAEELGPERRAEVWPAMRRQNPAIDAYASAAGRVLPIMLLRTIEADGEASRR